LAVVEQIKPFREIGKDGTLRLNLHPGQTRIHQSKKRIILALAGSQGGKTVYGPHWFDREIQLRGAGDYLIATSTFPLLSRKLLPEFLYVFQDLFHYGEYHSAEKMFIFHQEKKKANDYILFPESKVQTRVMFGTAQNPESLESATVLGVWLDECGQAQFRYDTYEAVQRRTLINRARILMTTTPYEIGWLKTQIYDAWLKGDTDIDVVQFDSTMNPSFPIEEYERMKATMPAWKFDMFHRGRFTQPAGMVYDAFRSDVHVMKPFKIPEEWPRYWGGDFGPQNTAGLWVAQDPNSGNLYVYREYWKGGMSTFEHVSSWIESSKGERIAVRMGGSPTEDGWRGDFSQAGWRIEKPLDGHVESGIQKVYGFMKLNKFFVFNTCLNVIDQLLSYSRELDDMYHVTDKIANQSSYHMMDAMRYLFSYFRSFTPAEETDMAPVAKLRR
jgi:hypothetical protein